MRLKSFGFGPGGFSLEFAEVKGKEPNLQSGSVDMANSSVEGFTSRARDLVPQVQDTSPLDYAIINLRNGKRWLTSRVYLFTVILHRMRHLRSVVFVDASAGIPYRMIGYADPVKLAWVLSAAFPWMERSLAAAIACPPANQPNAPKPVGPTLSPDNVASIIESYVAGIQAYQPQPPEPPYEWTQVEQRWEHARWVDADMVLDLLGNIINQSMIKRNDFLVRSWDEQAKLILSQEGPLVALLNDDLSFDKMIDREKFLERAAQNVVNYS